MTTCDRIDPTLSNPLLIGRKITIFSNFTLPQSISMSLSRHSGLEIKILNVDLEEHKAAIMHSINDDNIYIISLMAEFMPDLLEALITRKNTSIFTSDLDIHYLGLRRRGIQCLKFISTLGNTEVSKFMGLINVQAYSNPFLLFGLTIFHWLTHYNQIILQGTKTKSRNISDDLITLITGSLYNPLLGDKLEFLVNNQKVFERLGVTPRVIPYHLNKRRYIQLMNQTDLVYTYCRHHDSVLTRAIDAYMLGSIPVLHETNPTLQLIGEQYCLTYEDAYKLKSASDLQSEIQKRRDYHPRGPQELYELGFKNVLRGLFYDQQHYAHHSNSNFHVISNCRPQDTSAGIDAMTPLLKDFAYARHQKTNQLSRLNSILQSLKDGGKRDLSTDSDYQFSMIYLSTASDIPKLGSPLNLIKLIEFVSLNSIALYSTLIHRVAAQFISSTISAIMSNSFDNKTPLMPELLLEVPDILPFDFLPVFVPYPDLIALLKQNQAEGTIAWFTSTLSCLYFAFEGRFENEDMVKMAQHNRPFTLLYNYLEQKNLRALQKIDDPLLTLIDKREFDNVSPLARSTKAPIGLHYNARIFSELGLVF